MNVYDGTPAGVQTFKHVLLGDERSDQNLNLSSEAMIRNRRNQKDILTLKRRWEKLNRQLGTCTYT